MGRARMRHRGHSARASHCFSIVSALKNTRRIMKRNRTEFAKLRLSLVARLDKSLRRSRRALAQLSGQKASRYWDPDDQLTYRSQELLVRALITSETAGDRAPRIGSAALTGKRETIQVRYRETPFSSLGREGAMSDNSRLHVQVDWICKHWPTSQYQS